MNNPQRLTLGLLVISAEYGHVLSWAFDGSENDLCFQKLNYYLRKRCEILGEDPKNVRAAFNVTCCQGLKNLDEHWKTKIWPGCKRAPHKDTIHAMKKVSAAIRPSAKSRLLQAFECIHSEVRLGFKETCCDIKSEKNGIEDRSRSRYGRNDERS
jgi:hypothetical protein